MIKCIDHGVARELRFDRPPANALVPELMLELMKQLDETARPDSDLRAVVLSGAPGIFTGGLDVPYLLGLDRPALTSAVEVLFDLIVKLAECPLPVVAAITGHSPAAGAVIALCCDHRIMADGELVIGVNEVRVGLPIPEVVLGLVARQVGVRAAEHLCVTGRLLAPAEALAMGLVEEVVPSERVVGRSIEWCQELAKAPRYAVHATRVSARRDLVEMTRRLSAMDKVRFPQEWFRSEVQAGLRSMVERLKSKG